MILTIDATLHEVPGHPQLRSIHPSDLPAGVVERGLRTTLQLTAGAMVQAMSEAASAPGLKATDAEVQPLQRLLERLLTLVQGVDRLGFDIDVHASLREGIGLYGDTALIGKHGVEFWFSQMLRLLLQKHPDKLV